MTAGKPALTMRWLAAGGVAAPILDVLISAWLAALDPNYCHVQQFTSELGETGRPYGTVFSAWCVAFELLFAGFAVALACGLDRQRGWWLGPGALLVVAISSVLCGVFPCDEGCAGRNVSGHVHRFVGEIATVGVVLAPFLAWVGMCGNEAWHGCRALTLAVAGLLTVVGGWLAVCHDADLGRSSCALGAVQRLFLGILYVWVEVVAIRLWRLGAASERPAECERDGI